jgi:hypothetical protein
MRRSILLGVLTSLLMVVSVVASADASDPGGTFFDDDNSVHEGGIEAIAAAGITEGCNPPQNTEYCPGENVTRAQMATFVARALSLAPATDDYFIDDEDSVHEGGINRIREAGITEGCNPPTNDRFCPNQTMTRGQMAAFLARAFDFGSTDEDFFVDDNGHLFERAINRMAAEGVTEGCNPPDNDRFCPDAPVTRGQMATFLTRVMDELSPMAPPDRTDTALGSQLDLISIAASQGCDVALDEERGRDGITDECDATATVGSGDVFYVEHGWVLTEWSTRSSAEQQEFMSDSTRFDLSINGLDLALFESFFVHDDDAHNAFSFQFHGNLQPTTHTFVGEWVANDIVELRITLDLTVSP